MSTKQISMKTVERYIGLMLEHLWYCNTSPKDASTLMPSLFELSCLKQEVYRFCQNPESEFDNEALKEIDKEHIITYHFNEFYRRMYESYSTSTELKEKMIEDGIAAETLRFKNAVQRLSKLIRREELKENPRSPEEVFEEIRQNHIII